MRRGPGSFEELVALALMGGECSGPDLKKRLDAALGRSVSIGALYTCLGRMAAKGWVSARELPPRSHRGGRRRKAWALTLGGQLVMCKAKATRAELESLNL